MKLTASEVEESFIFNFIKKERRKRSLWALKNKKKRTEFLDRFNHQWVEMITKKYLTPVNAKSSIKTYDQLKTTFQIQDHDEVYIISYDENDGSFLDLRTAFENCLQCGYASLIINLDGTKYYLRTEQVQGAPNEFIGTHPIKLNYPP